MIIKRVYNIKPSYWDLDSDGGVYYRHVYHEFDVDYQETEDSEIKTMHIDLGDINNDQYEKDQLFTKIVDVVFDTYGFKIFDKTMEAAQQNPFELDLLDKD
jgi:hypothetical protein